MEQKTIILIIIIKRINVYIIFSAEGKNKCGVQYNIIKKCTVQYASTDTQLSRKRFNPRLALALFSQVKKKHSDKKMTEKINENNDKFVK